MIYFEGYSSVTKYGSGMLKVFIKTEDKDEKDLQNHILFFS